MTKPTREWFLILDDKLRMIGPKAYPDATAAILAANHQAPWPTFRGRLVVRSNYDEDGVKIGEGQGRVAATRTEGRWSGPEVTAGSGYLDDQSLETAHERQYNLPRTTKTPAQIRQEIKEVLSRHSTMDNRRGPASKAPRHHATRSNLKLTENQKAMLRAAADTGQMSSGRYGWNEMHVRTLEKKGLVQLVSRATWDKEWKLTDPGREVARALLAEWLSQVK